MLDPLGLLTQSESNIGRALAVISENLFLQLNAPVAIVDEQGDSDIAAIPIDVIPSSFPTRQYVERAIDVTRNIIMQLSDQPIDLIEVQFQHSRLDRVGQAEAFFGCPVEYRAAHNALYFGQEIFEHPVSKSGQAKQKLLKGYFDRAARSTNRIARQSASLEIARRMKIGDCNIESVAEALGTEPRTLQRRLRTEGFSFRDLVDQWRRDRALVLVTQTQMPLCEVADSLGYSDQSTFSTAFKSWFLKTPSKVRHSSFGRFG